MYRIVDVLTALSLVATTVLVAAREWGAALPAPAVPAAVALSLVLLSLHLRPARLAFVAIGAALTAVLALTREGWIDIALDGLSAAGFIAAFFTALSTLRNVAESSPSTRAAGRFLAAQPPGRRYLALTSGGLGFALLLNYGAISLLGSLATEGARGEPDPVLRAHRIRRMLLAIQRGFCASLPWSPLAFASAVTVALVPGATWAQSALPGLGTGAIILFGGWALDTIFKPRVVAPPRTRPEGSWALMMPLLGLLALLAVVLGTLHAWTGIRVVGLVMVVVPVLAIGWAALQDRTGGAAARLGRFLAADLPGYRGEIALLMMAGYIGTVGAPLLAPLVARAGIDLAPLPAWVVLTGFVWLIPILGQVGMNPILAVTLIAPMIPDAAALGVAPASIVAAIVAGWAISGVSSPFTATTLLIGAFGGVSASHVGLRWNGGFLALLLVIVPAWIVLHAHLTA